MKCNNKLLLWLLCVTFLNSCTTSGPGGLFGKRSPHEQYAQSLQDAGLKSTALGRSWFSAAERSLSKPLNVNIPYKESGYFPAEKAEALSIRFEAKRGEKLSISLQKRPATNFTLYVDLWEVKANQNKKLVAYADTGGKAFSYEIDDTGYYILRVQPELLTTGNFTLTVVNGPSLAFPVKNGRIGSFWGADRDDGRRRHEGIDIFAPRRTPALAAANGTISRVTTNQLGGKVIFMRPSDKNYSLYYAHLDEQLVSPGQKINSGDTIGLVGNTGNAISTSPHLHFGIYTMGGAIDPLEFVNPAVKPVPSITSALENLGKPMRTSRSSVNLKEGIAENSKSITNLAINTLLTIQSATTNFYRISLPDGRFGFIPGSSVNTTLKPLKQLKLSANQPLLDQPDKSAARKTHLTEGSTVSILGNFGEFMFVEAGQASGWISRE
ncbi:peptidoglycan DD-metalloendopeptidase family protein [Paradesertivirga mongoliensis]|uniref:Peptidoglycan DD-metalloendopeptidase family protein n=1 Tax=Paradesertivirga mongoliensis TaxID=2100740 RepID=A0ABW4ZQS9_9SPHI|nr:M23 family metallopeptidase [Pedobacter mongoliensis]